MSMEMFLQSGSELNDSDSDTEEPSSKRRCDRDEEPSTPLEGSENPSTSTVPSPNEPNPEGSHNDSETPGNNHEPVEDQSDPNVDNNPSEVQESHNDLETPGDNQPSSELIEDQSDPNVDNNPIEVNIKLIHLLPLQVPAQKLCVIVDLSRVLEDYFNRAIENCRLTANVTVGELDLTLSSSYGSKLQDDTDLLTRILAKIMTKTCQSKVSKVVFPEMRIDLLEVVMCGLKNEFCEKKSPQFCEIKLQFSAKDQKISHDDLVHIVEPLLIYKPNEICLHTNDSVESNISLTKKLKDVIQKKITEQTKKPKVRLNSKLTVSWKNDKKPEKKEKKVKKSSADKKSNIKQKRGSIVEPSSKVKIPKNLELQNLQSQVFAFDFHMMVPYSPGSSNFTAYKYWNLEKIHKNGFTGKGVTVAIVDSGISPHYAFGSSLIAHDFTDDVINIDMVGHGTVCAGILCGKSFQYYPDPKNESDSKISIFPSGVAPDANLVVCKVTSGVSNTATLFAVAKALWWISNNNKNQENRRIDVVSLSMGSLGISLDVVEAINDLVGNGVIIVCAASNYGHQFSQPICFPARLGHVLCIGSHGPHGKPSSFSPVGQDIDFLAPGEDIAAPNSMIANHVTVDSGTSYAAPAVAGLVCLILEYINLIGISNPPQSVKVANQYKNHWVMKEILRKISTCPGRHTDDEGFGALNPLYFFQQPGQIIKMINDEIINPVFMELSQQ